MSRTLPTEPFDLCHPELDLGHGRWLLEASAGTGKTYTIVGIVLRLVVEKGIPVDRCVIMTFTRAATAELRERLRTGLHQALQVVEGHSNAKGDPVLGLIKDMADRIPEARKRLRKALVDLDGALIATIHGFCHRLLADHALNAAVPLGADLDGDLATWREATVHDILRSWTRKLDGRAASLVAPALDPELITANCQRLEQHPEVTFTGVDAVGPERLQEMVDHVHQQWPHWRTDIIRFFTPYASILGPDYGPRELGQRLSNIGKCLEQGSDRNELAEIVGDIINPTFSRKNKKDLGSQAWHQSLLEMMRSLHGVRRHILEDYRLRLAQRPQQQTHLHYNDLLSALANSLDGPQGSDLRNAVAQQYDVALVDEFQDTDHQQWRIFDELFSAPSQRLFLIGDPKQAIYSFRGADIQAYLKAASTVPPDRCFTLGRNFRSDEHLVSAINDFFDRGSNTFVDQEIPFTRVSAQHPVRFKAQGIDSKPLQIWWQDIIGTAEATRRTIADRCAREIGRLLAHGQKEVDGQWVPLEPQDMAVLVRSHTQGQIIADALADMTPPIPCVRNLRQSVFASAMARELGLVLAGILAPHRERRVRAAAITRLGGIDPTILAQDTEHETLETLMLRLRELRRLWTERGFAACWQAMLDQGIGGKPLRALVAGEADGERCLTDLLHIGDLLLSACVDEGLGPEALTAWLERHIADPGSAADEQLQRLDRDDAAVRLMTVHSSKGLEFPVVFVPYLWSASSVDDDPIHYDQGQAVWHFSSDEQLGTSSKRTAALSEQLRLAYVALTRARYRCYLAFAPQSAWGNRSAGCTTSALTWLAWGNSRSSAADLGDTCALAMKEPQWEGEIQSGLRLAHHDNARLLINPEPAPKESLQSRQQETFPQAPQATWSPRGRQRYFSSYSGLIRNRPVEEPDHDQGRIESAIASDELLPRGAQFGTALHAVLEWMNFHEDLSEIQKLSAEALNAEGLADIHSAPLAQLLHKLCHTSIPDLGGSTLAQAADIKIPEMEVLLPVVSSGHIAEVFAEHGGIWSHYAKDLEGLTISPGFFVGIIDLVFFHQGRYHVLDWKSNALGAKGGYGHEAMAHEMRHHHYVLQYHLYTVALQRYLRLRLPDYAYDKHMGQAHYVFVRGVAQNGHGWYAHRPSQAMIDGLEACFGDHHG